jgi:streptogramin lyase
MAGTPVAVTAWVCVAGYVGKRLVAFTDTSVLSTAGSVYTTVPVAPTGRVKVPARVTVVFAVPTGEQPVIVPPETPGAESYTKSAYAAVGQTTASL